MPLYEYLCESCGERTEILQRFNDLPEVACPKCGAAMRRLPSAPSIQFKGSGFYLTDYAKKSGGTEGTSPRGGSDKAADKAGEKGSEAGAAKSAGSESAAGGGGSAAADSAPASPAPSTSASPAAGGAKGSSGSGGA
ncbi:MAG: FmdB family zinc ribbon protein [Thermoanaerobaculia bacterium]